MAYIDNKPVAFSPRIAVFEGGARKIASVTTEEDFVQKIKITLGEYAQPFSLKSIMLSLKLKTMGAGNVSLRIATNNGARYLAYREITLDSTDGAEKTILASVNANYFENGVTEGKTILTSYKNADATNLTGSRYLQTFGNISDAVNEPIKDIEIYLYASGYIGIMQGSTVEMWGC